MANKVLLKRSSTPGAIPLNTDLDDGEIAINTADSRIFFKNTLGVVKSISPSSGSSGVQNVFIQNSEPVVDVGTKALWIQTDGDDFMFWIKEG